MIDLHLHTTASDGSLTPAELVTKAHNEGVNVIAITDHDTIDGIEEAVATGAKYGMRIIPGIEISASAPGVEKEIHIIGLFIDTKSSKLLEQLHILRQYREERNQKLIANFNKIGISLTPEEITLNKKPLSSAGKPDFARAIFARGLSGNENEVFTKFLDDFKGLAGVSKQRLDIEECLELIHSASGIAILAHPFTTIPKAGDVKEFVRHLDGLDGIEVYYNQHKRDEVKSLRNIAKKSGLLMSGGSDFHREGSRRMSKLGFYGAKKNIPEEILYKMDQYRS